MTIRKNIRKAIYNNSLKNNCQVLQKAKHISFNLSTNDIMTATKDGDIYVRATLFDDKKFPTVLAVITREQWNHLMDRFFDCKSTYNENWKGNFCGVETIFAEGIKMKGKKVWLTAFDSDTEQMKTNDVAMYRITECSLEMEHG